MNALSWSRRFLARVESLGVGLLADQMREAGGSKQVRDVSVAPGAARARVGGVEVWADLLVFDAQQWEQAETALLPVRDRLLAGEVPPDVDALLARVGLPLLPAQAAELTLDCACGYDAGPCRHQAALLGAIALAFDHDPFLLLRWRGRDRARLTARLRREPRRVGPEPLSPGSFWTEPRPYPKPTPQPADPSLDQTPLDRLPPSLARTLRPLYQALIERDRE
ncbi:hypothetical protein [Streptacidiphilus fuscans]|uniref:SWIM-type domain-containing protein n=1 Tax=Streptacidiphilus fuscans TaxID=2789292 RepID=A0A931B664_9ACTN|nr:hypothetical protein [Streptacidiphilus fuscans]MBF9069736.1 hypothetical protein [Streptacidiphilus fuscans]